MKSLYISKALEGLCPKVHQAFKSTAIKYKFDLIYAGSPINVWIRDYMPIATNTGRVKFTYKTVGYEEYPQMKVKKRDTLAYTDRICDLILDGGNVVEVGNCVVCTEMVYRWNKDRSKNKVLGELENQFFKQVVVVPPEPGDTLGHSDGMLQPVAGNIAFVNRYRKMGKKYDQFKSKLYKILERAGIGIIEFPYTYQKCPQPGEEVFRLHYPNADDYNPGVGYYINYLRLGDLFFLPTFGFDEDWEAEETILKNIPNATVIKINCFDLAMTGGLLHCVTWTN